VQLASDISGKRTGVMTFSSTIDAARQAQLFTHAGSLASLGAGLYGGYSRFFSARRNVPEPKEDTSRPSPPLYRAVTISATGQKMVTFDGTKKTIWTRIDRD
jgi:hypothetical protein